MNEIDPYQAPQSQVINPTKISAAEQARLTSLADGQKLIIYAMLAYLVAIFTQAILAPVVLLILLVCLGLSLVGVFKVLKAFKIHVVFKVLLFMLLFLPLINLLLLLIINGRATKALREAGYSVGFLGAKKPETA